MDLVEDKHSRKLYALKRMNCHSEEDERNALREVEYMNSFGHRNLIVCEAHAVISVERSRTGVVSEVLVLMPFYRVSELSDAVVFIIVLLLFWALHSHKRWCWNGTIY